MKKCINLIVFLLLVAFPAASIASLETEVGLVNTNWKNKNHTAILQLITTRLNNDSDDVFATSLKVNYYIFTECDLVKARASADSLVTIVSAHGDSNATSLVTGIKNEVYSIPLSENSPYNQAQQNAIHVAFPNTFPNISICYGIANSLDPD